MSLLHKKRTASQFIGRESVNLEEESGKEKSTINQNKD
jgi:hypothetical protein